MATSPKPKKSSPTVQRRDRGAVASKTGMIKKAPAKPTNPRMAAMFRAQQLEDELIKQKIADNASPQARKAAKIRKAKEDKELARIAALKAKPPRDEYVPLYADQICERMAEGEEVGAILKELGISFGSMCAWMRKVPSFGAAFAIARENQAHLYISQITRISDSVERGRVDEAKLKVDTRKWLASKILNKIYGDKVTVAGDEQNPLVTKLVMGGDELAKKIKGVKP